MECGSEPRSVHNTECAEASRKQTTPVDQSLTMAEAFRKSCTSLRPRGHTMREHIAKTLRAPCAQDLSKLQQNSKQTAK
eukprot:6445170-Alexandrium_andersonii.AAC.1